MKNLINAKLEKWEIDLLFTFRKLDEQSKQEIIDLCRVKADRKMREELSQSLGKIISLGERRDIK